MPTSLRRVYDNVRTGQVVFRDVARLRTILTVLVRHGFGAFVQALKLQERWLPAKLLEGSSGASSSFCAPSPEPRTPEPIYHLRL